MNNYINANTNSDDFYWFPLRVSYDRSVLVAKELESHGIKSYSGEGIPTTECYYLPQKTITVHFDENDKEFYYEDTRKTKDTADKKETKRKVMTSKNKYFLVDDFSGVSHEDKDSVQYKFKVVAKPLLTNLLFIYIRKGRLAELKKLSEILSSVNFMYYTPHSEIHVDMSFYERNSVSKILILHHSEVDKFYRIVAEYNRSISVIAHDKLKMHIGKRIRIINGPLAGQEAVIRRIRGNKKVHFEISDLLTVQVDYIPNRMYEIIE